MNAPPETAPSHTPHFEEGDAHARAGEWLPAIESWRLAMMAEPSLVPGVEHRVQWFLAQTSRASPRSRPGPGSLVTVAAAASLLGTAFVLIPDVPGTTSSNLWAIAAWVMIVVACVATLLAAHASGKESLPHMISRAESIARQLDHDHSGDASTP